MPAATEPPYTLRRVVDGSLAGGFSVRADARTMLPIGVLADIVRTIQQTEEFGINDVSEEKGEKERERESDKKTRKGERMRD